MLVFRCVGYGRGGVYAVCGFMCLEHAARVVGCVRLDSLCALLSLVKAVGFAAIGVAGFAFCVSLLVAK